MTDSLQAMRRPLVAALLAALLSGTAAPAQETTAQTTTANAADARAVVSPEVQLGLDYLRRGDWEAAVRYLKEVVKRSKRDPEAWRALGLAYVEAYNAKEAVKAFRRALELRPDFPAARVGLAYALLLDHKRGQANTEARRVFDSAPDAETHFLFARLTLAAGQFREALRHADAALRLDPELAPAHLLRSHLLVHWRDPDAPTPNPNDKERVHALQRATGERMREAAASLETYLRLNPHARDAALWREQLETLRHYAQMREVGLKTEGRTLYDGREADAKAVLTHKPEPEYTEEARRNGVRGRVRLQMTLDADGTVKHVLVLESLPFGLTESAVRAARRIRFTPATVGGRPVSTPVVVEYNFDIY
jgi:TonB family protein